jgi:hypothetical protein
MVGPEHWVLCDACGGQTDFVPEARRSSKSVFHPLLIRLLAVYVICTFLWRVLVTAHEYPMRSAQVMSILFDLACVIALGTVCARQSTKSRSTSWLSWVALLCALGLFAIRLHGPASWWTGHWNYDWRR